MISSDIVMGLFGCFIVALILFGIPRQKQPADPLPANLLRLRTYTVFVRGHQSGASFSAANAHVEDGFIWLTGSDGLDVAVFPVHVVEQIEVNEQN